APSLLLHVEPEKYDVAVLHDVLAPLAADQPALAGGLERAGLEEVRPAQGLGADEAALEVGVDLASGFGRAGALADGPGPDLLLPRREEADEAEQAVARLDEPVEAAALQPEVGQERGALVRIQLAQLGLDPCGKRDQAGRLAVRLDRGPQGGDVGVL